MNFLDTRTALFSDLLSSLICGVVMASIWMRYRYRSPAFAFWLAAYGLHAISVLLVALRGKIPDLVSVLPGVPLFLGGTLLLLLGLEYYVGRNDVSRSLRLNCVSLALLVLIHVWFTLGLPNLQARNLNLMLGLVFFMGQAALLLLRPVTAEFRSATRLPGLVFAAFVAVGILRAFVEPSGPAGQDFLKSGLFASVVLMTNQMLFVALAFGLLLMSNHRLFVWLEQDTTERKRVEETLQTREEEYRLVVNNVGEALLVLQGWKVVFANPAASRMTGYPHEELLGLAFIDSTHPDDHALVADRYRRRAAGEDVPGRYQFRIIRADGETRHVETSAVRMTWEGGPAVLYFLADVTERKQAEDELRISEERYRVAEAIGHVGNWEYNLQTTRFWGSDEAKRIYGFDPEALDFSADEVESCIPERERVHQALVDLIQADKPYNLEFEIHPKDSLKPRFISAIAELKRDEHGNPLLVSGVIQDITERKQAEVALRTNEAQLTTAVQMAKLGYWDYDVADDLFTFNDQFYSILRTTAEKVGGYKMSSAQYARQFVHPDDAPVVGEQIRAALETTDPHYAVHTEGRAIFGDGSVGYLSVQIDIIKDSHGRTVRLRGANQDITERKQIEAALRASEEEYRLVVENVSEIIFVIQDWKVVFANPSASKVTGYSHEQLVGRAFLDSIHPDDRAHTADRYRRRIAGEVIQDRYVFRIVRKDGQTRHVEDSAVRMVWKGEPANLYFLADVTEREQAEQQAQAERDRLRNVLDGMPDLVYIVNRDCDVGYVNPAMERTFGSLRGRKCHDYLAQRTDVCPDCPNERVLAGGTDRREVRTEQGVIYDVFSTPMANRDGSVSKLGMLHDITELKQAQEREAKHLQHMQSLRKAAMGFVQMRPGEDIYRHVAERLRELCGQCYVVVNSYDAKLSRCTVRAIAGLGAELQKAVELLGREPIGTEFQLKPGQLAMYSGGRLRQFDGITELSSDMLPKALAATLERTFGVGDIYSVTFYWRGELLGTASVLMRRGHELRDPALVEAFVDQTAIALRRWLDEEELERHRLHLQELVVERTRELEVAQAKLILQEKLATLGRVAGSVAHELRSPLGVMRNASFFLQRTVADKLEGKPLRHLQIIDESVQRANQAITMILDFTWQQRNEMKRCALKPILDRAVADSAMPANVQVSFELPPHLPRVDVDDRQMAAVFRNLLTNAVQAMPAGGAIRIGAGTRDTDVIVTISDTGSGIKPEHMQRLFEPLFTTKSIGVGLGLAICKVFVETNKGTISVASEVGKGTTFTITLPAADGGEPS